MTEEEKIFAGRLFDARCRELKDIKQLKKEILDKARAEAAEIIAGANRQVENTIRTIRERQAEKEWRNTENIKNQ